MKGVSINVLLVGDGAREHILAEKLSEDSNVYAIMSRTNPGIVGIAKSIRICDLKDAEAVRSAAESFSVSFDVGFVSPDAILAAGITNVLAGMNIPMASPTKAAARIEWDKSFARNLMEKYKIDGLPRFNVLSNEDNIVDVFDNLGKVVIKPLGLTGGKGVKVMGEHLNFDESVSYARELIRRDGSVLIEEKVVGEEFTLQAFSDGRHIVFMPPVQDHKRLLIGDKGPNTGGMGSYSTGDLLPFLRQSDVDSSKKIIQDTIWAMSKEGAPFRGVLYGQFMATKFGIKVIEFNSRFGDPEVINVLSLLDGSLSNIFISISDGSLVDAKFINQSTVVKYLVPDGYPTNPKKDMPLELDMEGISRNNARVYFASVYEEDGKIFTTSSRSVAIVAVSNDIYNAEKVVEDSIQYIHGDLFHRADIGTKKLIDQKILHMKSLRE